MNREERLHAIAASADPVISGVSRREGMSLDAVFDDVSAALKDWSTDPEPVIYPVPNRRQRRANAAAARRAAWAEHRKGWK